MKTYELTDYIINNNKIEEILEAVGCHHIKSYTKEFRCGLPNYSNPTSISVKKETLKVKIYTSNNKIKGDIYTLVMNIYQCSFPEASKKIHKILGLKYVFKIDEKKEIKKKDILSVFKKALKKNKVCYEKEKLNIYKEEVCNEFISIPYIEWIKEGILPSTQRVFNIGYSRDKNRVVIPHRYWCGCEDEYVGIMGRTLNENYNILDIPKYYPLIKFPKSMNLYGLQENYEYIQQAGYVNVFEAEKSTLKRHSRLDKACVSLGGHEISEEQAKILISLNVDIIIQMDKDIDINHIRSLCEMFYGIRNVYYVYDEFGLLKEKESPADKHNKIYWTLWNRKVKYDDVEHRKFLEWREQSG